MRLYALIQTLNENKTLRVYFCTRAGITLQHMLDMFMKKNNLVLNVELVTLPVSRLSVFIALIGDSPLYAGQQGSLLFPGKKIKQIINYLHKGREKINVQDYIKLIPKSILTMKISPWSIREWRNFDRDNISNQMSFTKYSQQQKALLSEYFPSDIDLHLIVDSGLYGSTIEMLSAIESDKKILGAMVYFSNYRYANPVPHFDNCTGLMAFSGNVNFDIPHSSVLLHWHLIENILEPQNMSSITSLPANVNIQDIKYNSNTQQVFNYFNSDNNYDIKEVLYRLMKILAIPTKENIKQIYTSQVCNDVDGTLLNVILSQELQKKVKARDKLSHYRVGIINRSLWKPAQRVISYGIWGYMFNLFTWYYKRYIK
ncbi:MAG: hypothetical protein KAH18_05380 [Psychromonas sp.]|nr:hypothetical protein [Psychromonas sp.]